MIYLQPITFFAIVRTLADPNRTEIAEHPDGALKAYAERWKANEALMQMNGPNSEYRAGHGWRVDEILMVPPPMTAPRLARLREEVGFQNPPRSQVSKPSATSDSQTPKGIAP